MGLFSSIREWLTFAADICILLITLYIFYITFISQKIKFISVSKSLSIAKGNSFSVVLENKSLSPQVIIDMHLIVDGKYKINVKKFETPFILEPYKAQKVVSDKYSYTEPPIPHLKGKNTILEVVTTRRKLYLYMNKKTPRVTKEMKNIPYNVMKIRSTYNGKIVPENARFVLFVSKGDWQKTIFIFKTGVMTSEILGYNGIPEEVLKDQESVNQFLDSWLKPSGLSYYVDQLPPKIR